MIDKAINVAMRSTNLRHKVGAVIVHDNMTISAGWAHRSHQMMTDPNYRFSIHAELHAIMRGRPTPGATAYIACITANNTLAVGKPCKRCAALLIEFGVREVFYTIHSRMDNLKFEHEYLF